MDGFNSIALLHTKPLGASFEGRVDRFESREFAGMAEKDCFSPYLKYNYKRDFLQHLWSINEDSAHCNF